jgi:hypothetical protein
MILPISQQIPPQLIHIGDHVTVTNPEFILRVGYPISFDDAFNYVEKNYLQDIEDFVNKKILNQKLDIDPMFKSVLASPISDKNFHKILSGLAGIYLDANSHGGKERSIHTYLREALQGKTFEVISKKVVKTGTYYPPRSQQSYEGEWNCGLGGLDNCKTHVVLELDDHTMYWNFKNKWDGCWIESCNVRKA